MARTKAASTLTEQHRRGQLAIRALAIRQFFRLWPLWKGDEASFQDLLAATFPLVLSAHRLSSTFAASYFQTFRAAEEIDGDAFPQIALPLEEKRVFGTLHLVGSDMTKQALLSGKSPEEAMQLALVRTSGSVGRFTLDGGRETIVNSSTEDAKALGWARVTDGDPCSFCRLLASRGPVYKESTVGFEAHDHCGCGAEVYYPGAEWPGLGKQFRSEYNEAIRQATARGDLRRGTDNDLSNAYRRYLAEQNTPSAP